MTDPRDLKLTLEPLSVLLKRKRADNPKLHDEAAIQASMNRAGYITPTIVNDWMARSSVAMAGSMRSKRCGARARRRRPVSRSRRTVTGSCRPSGAWP